MILEESTYGTYHKMLRRTFIFLITVFLHAHDDLLSYFCIFSMEEPGLAADVAGGAFLQAVHGSQAGYLQHFFFPFERENFNTLCIVNQQ